MAYLSAEQLNEMGFKYIGENVKISDKASIYNCDHIEIGDHSRIDDFCVISGKVQIGQYCHITPMCLLAGGMPGITLQDFVTLAYGVKIFSQSDDYSGNTMTNSLIPGKYKNEYKAEVVIEKYSIIGTNSIVLPGVNIAEGSSIGAMTLILKNTMPWGIYIGIPGKRVKDRSRKMLELVDEFNLESNK